MSVPPPSLAYATPPKKSPFRLGFFAYGPFLFWLIATASSFAVIAFNGFILKDSNELFGPFVQLIVGTLFAGVAFGVIDVLLVVFIILVEKLKPSLEARHSVPYWFTMGALTGLLTTIPPTIDALTWTHVRQEGYLETQGWGYTARIICLCLIPLLTLLFAFHRHDSLDIAKKISSTLPQK